MPTCMRILVKRAIAECRTNECTWVESQGIFMQRKPANRYWLQNNNTPPRQSNQMRPGPGGRPNGQPPNRGLSVNRWLLIIVLVMLGIYLYQFLSANNSSSSQTPVDQLSYSDLDRKSV